MCNFRWLKISIAVKNFPLVCKFCEISFGGFKEDDHFLVDLAYSESCFWELSFYKSVKNVLIRF